MFLELLYLFGKHKTKNCHETNVIKTRNYMNSRYQWNIMLAFQLGPYLRSCQADIHYELDWNPQPQR